jgi:hypothetical protein
LIFELLKLIDPSYITEKNATIDLLARLGEIKPFGERPDLVARLQRDLPTYIASSNGFSIDHGDVENFTKGILSPTTLKGSFCFATTTPSVLM